VRKELLVVLFSSIFAETALADEGTVTLHDGSVIRGDISEYEPGSGVTVVLSDGQTLRLDSSRVARVEIGAPGASPAPTAAAPGAPDPAEVRRSRYDALPPAPDWLRTEAPAAAGRAPRLTGPLVTGLVGGLFAMVGATTLSRSSGRPTDSIGAGLGATLLAVGGGLFFINLVIVVPIRAGQRRRWFRREGFSARLPLAGPGRPELFF